MDSREFLLEKYYAFQKKHQAKNKAFDTNPSIAQMDPFLTFATAFIWGESSLQQPHHRKARAAA